MAKRKTDKHSATETSDSDNWLASFADARHILVTRFRNSGDLGDGPAQISGLAAARQALAHLDLCRDIVGEVSDPAVRQRLSIVIELLIERVALSAPAAIATSKSLDLSSNEPEEHIEDDVSDDEGPLELEILHDPDYSPALDALKERGDPKPIARLLKQGVPMPDWIARDLGVMLHPSDSYRGIRLTVKTNNGPSWREVLPTLVRRRDAGNRFRELRAKGATFEDAVAQVAEESGMGETWVKSCIKIDDGHLVRATQGYLGYDDDDVTF